MGTDVFWVRLFCAEFDDPRWLAIEQLPDADAVQIIYIRMLMLAGRSNAGGILLLHESLPYDITTLSAVLRRTVPVIQFSLATLERFRFIEVVDRVIAITDWDKLQATNELARIDAQRQKDKERKRIERAQKRKLLIESVDTSKDSPRISSITETDLNSDSEVTTHSIPTQEVVVELERVLEFIPQIVMNKRLQNVITNAISQNGGEMALSNIRYALNNHDPSKGKLGGMICSAIENDYAKEYREKARKENEDHAAVKHIKKLSDAMKNEIAEIARLEKLAQEEYWASLLEDEQEIYRQNASASTAILLDLPSVAIEAIARITAWEQRSQLSTIG